LQLTVSRDCGFGWRAWQDCGSQGIRDRDRDTDAHKVADSRHDRISNSD